MAFIFFTWYSNPKELKLHGITLSAHITLTKPKNPSREWFDGLNVFFFYYLGGISNNLLSTESPV